MWMLSAKHSWPQRIFSPLPFDLQFVCTFEKLKPSSRHFKFSPPYLMASCQRIDRLHWKGATEIDQVQWPSSRWYPFLFVSSCNEEAKILFLPPQNGRGKERWRDIEKDIRNCLVMYNEVYSVHIETDLMDIRYTLPKSTYINRPKNEDRRNFRKNQFITFQYANQNVLVAWLWIPF